MGDFFRNHNNVFIFIGILILVCSTWIYSTSAPKNIEIPISVVIEEGSSLKEITKHLKEVGLIRSKTVVNALIILGAGDSRVVSGEYLFESHPSAFDVVRRITRGDFGIDVKEVTFPEGVTVEEIALIMESRYPYFEKEAFMQLASESEGLLFPDTYLFLENVKAYEVYGVLKDNFEKKITEISGLLKESKRSLEDVVIMASIVEKEATADSRQEVANILWKRLEMGMPLQVDATFVYSIDKGTFDLTKKDLTDEENPYNTYIHEGLPPTPIGNPGLDSLKASATASNTKNLFFLTGHDGEMYYATTFDEHKTNKRKYLQ